MLVEARRDPRATRQTGGDGVARRVQVMTARARVSLDERHVHGGRARPGEPCGNALLESGAEEDGLRARLEADTELGAVHRVAVAAPELAGGGKSTMRGAA
jgi:hypothetical protein